MANTLLHHSMSPTNPVDPRDAKGKWVVHIEGDPSDEDDPVCELSVCREDSHGIHSWGWAGADKIIIQDDLDPYDFDSKTEFYVYFTIWKYRAKLIANALNADQ